MNDEKMTPMPDEHLDSPSPTSNPTPPPPPPPPGPAFGYPPPPPPGYESQSNYGMPPADNRRLTAGLIAIIAGALGLGWIGAHKFYLGYNKEGIIYLAVSILTCGIGAAVMTIISIVEGIFYLSKSDNEFYNTYIAGHQGWF